MQIHRLIGLVITGATLALGGCAATAPKQPDSSVPDTALGESSVVRDAFQERVVEAEGIAHMGDEDLLKDVRKRAERDAIRKLLQAGAPLYVEEYRKTEFQVLIDDTTTERSRGVLLERRIDKQGLDGNIYRVVMSARYRPVDPKDSEPEPRKRAQQADEEVETTQASDNATREASSESPPVSTSGTERRATGSTASGEGSVSTRVAKAPDIREEPRESTPTTRVSRSTEGITVCCHDFPDVLQRRVFSVLSRIEGITQLERSNTAFGSLCYRFHYDGPTAVLEDRLEGDLRTSATVPFRIERNRGTNVVDLVFDGGFD